MRFFLLARARSTGLIRLLSERAFDSRSAAVEAASATASDIDLSDDEVLAVDLDAAGPVLVLRVPPRQPASVPTPARPAVGFPTVVAPTAPIAQPSERPSEPAATSTPVVSPFDDEPAAWRRYSFEEPAVRLQPRFPLFGTDDDVAEEDLSETLRRVARRMESDLTFSGPSDWAAADDTWDARTLDDYAVPDDSHMSGAREEGRLRIDAAERLDRDESTSVDDADDRLGASSADGRAEYEASVDDDLRREDVFPTAMFGPEDAGGCEDRTDEPNGSWGQTDDTLGIDPEAWLAVEDASAAVTGVSAAEDGSSELLADRGDRPVDDADLAATAWDEAPSEADVTAPEYVDFADVSDATPFDVELVALTAALDPEPAPYRPANVDFAMWVCADCVYQRTCRQAGISSPSKCGNFQWRSF